MDSIYTLSNNNKKTGPFSVEEINAKLKDSILNSNSLAWTKGQKEWKPLKNASFLNLGVKLIDDEMPPPWDDESISTSSKVKDNKKLKKPDIQASHLKVFRKLFCLANGKWTIFFKEDF